MIRYNVTCAEEAYNFQPKSLLYIIEHDSFSTTIVNIPDNDGYTLVYKIKDVYPEIDILNDIKNIKLTKYNNIFEDGDNNPCMMCCEFKKSIVFNCGHLACVGCAFKLKDCPQCRNTIKEKTYIFE